VAGTFPALRHPPNNGLYLVNPNLNNWLSIVGPLLGAAAAKRHSVLCIDMGQRVTKAVHIHRKGDRFELLNYALVDAPSLDKAPTPQVLGQHLKAVAEAAGYRGRRISVIIGVADALVRHAEMPAVPAPDMRLMLKYNSKAYLQQEFPDYTFDCQTLGFVDAGAAPGEAAEAAAARTPTKARVLIGATKQQTLDQLNEAATAGGLTLDEVTPSLICPSNAFEAALPQEFGKDVIALVDIGFKSSTISILTKGELSLSRVVSLGADKLTAGLAEAMGVSYSEAEGIKVGLPEEVQGAMQGLIMPLGRELRASIDFFEHQQEKSVSQIFVSGGSARSPFIVESLQSELMVQTKTWNPVSFMTMALPAEKLAEIEQTAPQLAVAVGGALVAL
jgi:type IV pilus assembly protein PilM